MRYRRKKTIAALFAASIAVMAGVQWMSCSPKGGLDDVARFAEGVPGIASSADAIESATPDPSAMSATPTGTEGTDPPGAEPTARHAQERTNRTVLDVLTSSVCTTDAVKGLSEQIIAEEGCLRPNAFQRLPDQLASANVEEVVFPFLAGPAHEAFLTAVGNARRGSITVNSMLRTIAQQYLLFNWYRRGRCHIKLAANPGTSNHQSGLAIDIAEPGRWRQKLARNGFRWMGSKDRWHFDFVGRTPEEKAEVKRILEAHEGLDVRAFQRLWNRNHPDESLGEGGTFDDRTERALRRAPAGGFPAGSTCGK